MDTDALVINNNEDDFSQTPVRSGGGLVKIKTMLKNNPEIPDALRDLAPYFSPELRKSIFQFAAFGDFMLRMSDSSAFEAAGAESPVPLNQLYGTMKKYIPMNKRQSIDGIMGLVDNIKVRMQPKPAANGLENIINRLTRLNEMNKLMTSAGTVKKLANSLKNPENKKNMDVDGMISLINNLVGDDKMKQISSMLGKMLG